MHYFVNNTYLKDIRRVYTTEKIGSGPVKKVVRTHNFCKEMLEFPQGHRRLWPCGNCSISYKSYGSVVLFWQVRTQIFLPCKQPYIYNLLPPSYSLLTEDARYNDDTGKFSRAKIWHFFIGLSFLLFAAFFARLKFISLQVTWKMKGNDRRNSNKFQIKFAFITLVTRQLT